MRDDDLFTQQNAESAVHHVRKLIFFAVVVQRGSQDAGGQRMVDNREQLVGQASVDLPLHPQPSEIEAVTRTRLYRDRP